MMQIFNGTIRLQGQTHHEVAKRGLTVPEIYILRRIHGSDAVVRLEHVGMADVDPLDERERLDYEYAAGLSNLHDDQKTSVEKMFGADFTPLPEVLRDYDGVMNSKVAALVDFQESEPFQSPDAEDKGAQIRKKAAAKAATKIESIKDFPAIKSEPVKGLPLPKSSTKKTALDAVM